MEFFFKPRSVAVIGATPNQAKGGNAILRNLLWGYPGKIYPVNPRYSSIEGLVCHPRVSDIAGPLDTAIIFVPAAEVPAALEDCAIKGVPGVIIESSGFAEIGGEGIRRQELIKEIAARAGMRIWGPNCMGFVDARSKHVFSFLSPGALQYGLIPGKVSLIVQSGMLSAGFLLDIMSQGIMGISKACSIGNKADIDENDLLEYLLEDPDTDVIGLYLESFVRGREFIELCRRGGKPVVVLKGGKSSSGAKAALSHTASLAGNHDIVRGALAQAGVVEAKEFKQMMDLCRSLAYGAGRNNHWRKNVAVLAFSGGAAILSADFIEETGLEVASISSETKKTLAEIFPDWMPVRNPVDLWPAIEKQGPDGNVYNVALEAVLADENVDAVLLHAVAGAFRVRLDLAEIVRLGSLSDKPVFLWIMGTREEIFQFQKEAGTLGLPVFQDLYRAVECLAATLDYRPGSSALPQVDFRNPSLPGELSAILEGKTGVLDEHLSKRILKAAGIPTVPEELLVSEGDLEEIINGLGFPLVMKGLLAGTVHKTETGLVAMNIENGLKARESLGKLKEIMAGRGDILIQKQIPGRLELIIGLLRDPQFGVAVMLGLGGITAEVLKDAAFAIAPLSHKDALSLIGRIKARQLLDGFRGSKRVDRDRLAQLLVNLGNLGLAYPRIKELDINPLIAGDDGFWAVDASLILED